MTYIQKKFSKEEYYVTYSVNNLEHNMRMDQFLTKHFASFSREQIKKKIASGDIEIIGRPGRLKASTKVKEGETVAICTKRGAFEDEFWNGKKIILEESIEIIENTDDYIVINKPPFMATHPTGKHLFYCATIYLSSKFQQKFSSVHRLDRETSGTIILAKHAKAAQILTELFETKQVAKAYFFIAKKKLTPVTFPFIAKERLGQELETSDQKPDLYTYCYPENSNQGKMAETRFEKLWENEQYLLGLAFPLTGRQHQIRAHAAHHGLPLVGDKLYNGDPTIFSRFKDQEMTDQDYELLELPRHALHAVALKLPEPVNRLFISHLPTDLKQWIACRLEVSEEIVNKRMEEILAEVFH